MKSYSAFLLAALLAISLPADAAINMVTIGDSWTAGVGVATSCYPRSVMSSATCSGGQSIVDNLAVDLGVTAYQNLGFGGAMLIDALTLEVPLIDKTANLVVVNIGFNDETPIGDGHDQYIDWSACAAATRSYFPIMTTGSTCGYTEPYTASTYNPDGFAETPDDFQSRYTQLIQQIQWRVPKAKIYVLIPAINYDIPQLVSGYNSTQIGYYTWSNTQIANTINGMSGVTVINFGGASIYSSSYYVNSGTCPTAGIGDCGGHPNSTGAAVMATAIATAIPH